MSERPTRSRTCSSRAILLCLGAWVSTACAGGPSTRDLARAVAEAEQLASEQEAFAPTGGLVEPTWYRGPGVVEGRTGPARFARTVRESFDIARAMARVEWLDSQYRAPANDDYEAALDRLAVELESHGFGREGSGLELEVLEGDPVAAWTPVRGSIHLIESGFEPALLHAFDDRSDPDRVLLPIHAPSASLEGTVVLGLDEVTDGTILVTREPLRRVQDRARERGAVAVVSASTASFNVDPTGRERHLDAIQFQQLSSTQELPVFQISARAHDRIAAAVARGDARLRLEATVETEQRPCRTLVARVKGKLAPEIEDEGAKRRVVAIAAHLQEPGANDNGTGVSALIELACVLAEGIESRTLQRPNHGIAFVLGDEMDQTRAFLEATDEIVIAGISADMVGASFAETGAIALLERAPDPGAIAVYPPDEHTPWGAREVDASELIPNGLAVIARCATIDTGLIDGGWAAADHPFEGGSDHDVFLARGIPAMLFWHFTDFTYHTSLDRFGMVDGEELARSATAILSTALAVADAKPFDLERYLRSLDLEVRTRARAAAEAFDPETQQAWRDWGREARYWLRALCLGISLDEARPPQAVSRPD